MISFGSVRLVGVRREPMPCTRRCGVARPSRPLPTKSTALGWMILWSSILLDQHYHRVGGIFGWVFWTHDFYSYSIRQLGCVFEGNIFFFTWMDCETMQCRERRNRRQTLRTVTPHCNVCFSSAIAGVFFKVWSVAEIMGVNELGRHHPISI